MVQPLVHKKRRTVLAGVLTLVAIVFAIVAAVQQTLPPATEDTAAVAGTSQAISSTATSPASEALASLAVKGRAPKTDYAREQFSAGWARVGACDMRQYILARDMTDVAYTDDGCTVRSGTLADPYTGTTIAFVRGTGTSSAVQIDHVVALSNAWQTGAQQLDVAVRAEFANDPLNLLAVDGPTNQKKNDGDAATWLPPSRDYRCRYVARQIAVKQKYTLWVTQAEHDAMARVLSSCPDQVLPIVETEAKD